PRGRPAHVPADDLRQGGHGGLHHHNIFRDALQLSRLPLVDRRHRHLYLARDHAGVGCSLHLACVTHSVGARMIAILLAWLLGTLQAAAPAAPKQAVVETTAGTFVVDLDANAAPLTAAYFMKTAEAGGYEGTIFHKMIKYGIVQGGDPLTKDPSKRAQWGTGGLNAVKDEAKAAK